MTFKRSGSASEGLTRMTPQSTKTQSAPSVSMTPYPVMREPESMPITRIGFLGNSSFELGLLDVEVAIDVLNVVMLVEGFHEFQDPLSGLAFNLDVVLRNH